MPHPRHKQRIDSWETGLSEEQCWTIYERLLAYPIATVQDWITQEYRRPRPARTTLYRFCDRMRARANDRRIQQTIIAMQEAKQLASIRKDPDDVANALANMAAEITLRTGSADEAKPILEMAVAISEQARKATELSLKERRVEHDAETLRLAREKFEAAEARLNAAAGIVQDGELSDIERLEKVKAIFGITK